MSTSIFNSSFASALLLCLSLISCGKSSSSGEVLEPVNMEALSLPSLEGRAGIYPSEAVLQDAQNPFVRRSISTGNRWSLTGWAMQPGVPVSRLVAMFYAWATELTAAKNGESQFQVAIALKAIASHESLDETTRAAYRLAAIDAYQSMLDNFKDSLGYTAEGYSYRLVPIAFYAIRDLGGTPKGRWIETVDPYGNKIVVEY